MFKQENIWFSFQASDSFILDKKLMFPSSELVIDPLCECNQYPLIEQIF